MSVLSQEYLDYLQSARWLEYRDQIIRAHGGRCTKCKRPDAPLEVHHLTYDNLYHEEPADCVPLCRDCHREADGDRKRRAQRRRTSRRVRAWSDATGWDEEDSWNYLQQLDEER